MTMSGQLLGKICRMASTGNFSSTMPPYTHEAALTLLISQHGECTHVNISGYKKDNK
jgi:hypothetical protein